jgi:hypothetical protein
MSERMMDYPALGRCSTGAATDTPCLRPAVYQDGDDGPRFCERHLQVVWMRGLVSEVETFMGQRLDELKEWADRAEGE